METSLKEQKKAFRKELRRRIAELSEKELETLSLEDIIIDRITKLTVDY